MRIQYCSTSPHSLYRRLSRRDILIYADQHVRVGEPTLTPRSVRLLTVINSNAEIAIGIICACLPSLSALVSRAYHEYSSKRTTQNSEQEMSNMKPPIPPRHQRRRNSRLSQFDLTTTDQDTLVQHAQGHGKIETSVGTGTSPQDGQDGLEDGRGILRTVDLSTSFSPKR